MKKSIYLVSILSILSFIGCSSMKQKKALKLLKDIPSKTCAINGGSSASYYNNKGCKRVAYVDAQQICQDVGGRLPTLKEVKALAIDCGSDFTLNERELMKKDRKYSVQNKYEKCMNKEYHLYFLHNVWTSTFVPGSNSKEVFVPNMSDIQLKEYGAKINEMPIMRIGGKASVFCINPSVK